MTHPVDSPRTYEFLRSAGRSGPSGLRARGLPGDGDGRPVTAGLI